MLYVIIYILYIILYILLYVMVFYILFYIVGPNLIKIPYFTVFLYIIAPIGGDGTRALCPSLVQVGVATKFFLGRSQLTNRGLRC